jgi:uncharacterized protein (DUF1330 family)
MTEGGHVDPTRAAFGAFRAMERDGPVHMLNLVRLRAEAAYDDGTTATGAEAYAAYGRESAPIFARVGGRIVWRATPELTLIGPDDERWDIAFVAEYPSPAAFVDMVKDADYQRAVRHRQAAVATSRLIRTAPAPAGRTFAGPA